MSIGTRIRNRRLQLGMSVDDLAAALGKNRATVYRYENDEIKEMPTTVLEPLAQILQTTPADLMGWYGEPKDNNNILVHDFIISAEEKEIVLGYRAADHSTQAIVRKILDVADPVDQKIVSLKQDTTSHLTAVAAHAKEGATPEEQGEDVDMLTNSTKEKEEQK